MKRNFIRIAVFVFIFRPLVWIFLGLNVKNRKHLPLKGPAIVVANHNSHLDTIVLMSLYPLRLLSSVRPVAAADYFLCNRYLQWFCKNILQIIPIQRSIHQALMNPEDPLHGVSEASDAGSIVIYYPEGTRGEPEQMGRFKTGIARLSERHPGVPIVPIYLRGLGKALPKGKALLVPFNADVVLGKPFEHRCPKHEFVTLLREQVCSLEKELQYA